MGKAMQRYNFSTRQEAEEVCPTDCFVRKQGRSFSIVANNRAKSGTKPSPLFYDEEKVNKAEFRLPIL